VNSLNKWLDGDVKLYQHFYAEVLDKEV